MIQSSVAYVLVIIFISVVYISRERGQITYLLIYLFTCVLEGNKKKTKGVKREQKEWKGFMDKHRDSFPKNICHVGQLRRNSTFVWVVLI